MTEDKDTEYNEAAGKEIDRLLEEITGEPRESPLNLYDWMVSRTNKVMDDYHRDFPQSLVGMWNFHSLHFLKWLQEHRDYYIEFFKEGPDMEERFDEATLDLARQLYDTEE
jgi:hypothetical protein|tara:strand:- start:1253 stop:1585 length:333 start_codon:yes stop_codon:yes gene_type:complete